MFMGLEWFWIIALVAGVVALLLPLLVGLPKVNISRRPAEEGFDDITLGAGFAAIQDRLEFKSMRRSVVKHLIESVGKEAKMRVLNILDLGCGTGHLIKAINDETMKKGGNIMMHGIDIGAASVQQCKDYLNQAGLHSIDVKEGDGARMPYPDGSMDVVVTSLSLHHWSKPEAVLTDIYRVLKPGGRLVLFDLRRDARKFYHHAFEHWFTPRMPEPLKSAGDPYSSMCSAYTPGEMREMLGHTPWVDEQVEIMPRTVSFFVDGVKRQQTG
jgi:ubiquinone/menaquinone biosynthesis C-methylase UbiE